MEPLSERHARVAPCFEIIANGVTDFAGVSFYVEQLEKKVVFSVTRDHEWIGYEACWYIGDIIGRQDGVVDFRNRLEQEGIRPLIQADRPGLAVSALYFRLVSFQPVIDE